MLLTETKGVSNRWKEYIEDLYASEEKPNELPLELDVDKDNRGPEILKEEIVQVIDHLADRKSEGAAGIPAKMWKILGGE